jgi:hypothetical protein
MTPDDNTVAYPGREGAHTAAACDRLFPAARLVSHPNFSEVVDAVVSRDCTYGVLPIESSLAGPVNETHDLLYDSPLSIVAEAILPIRHCLVGVAGASLADIREIRSHPMALDQCRGLLARLSGSPRVIGFTSSYARESLARIFYSDSYDPGRGGLYDARETRHVVRINLGLFQPDVNVIWDLAPHDLSILTYLVDQKPVSINATGISHTNNNIENIAYMTVNYDSDFIAHFNVSWTSPVKVRQTLIGGDIKMIVYNDLEPSEKIRVYDTGYNHKTEEYENKIMVDYRTGDVYIPKLGTQEALLGVANDFIQCIINKKEPKANAHLGRQVVRILEASQVSIKNNGKEVCIR